MKYPKAESKDGYDGGEGWEGLCGQSEGLLARPPSMEWEGWRWGERMAVRGTQLYTELYPVSAQYTCRWLYGVGNGYTSIL